MNCMTIVWTQITYKFSYNIMKDETLLEALPIFNTSTDPI